MTLEQLLMISIFFISLIGLVQSAGAGPKGFPTPGATKVALPGGRRGLQEAEWMDWGCDDDGEIFLSTFDNAQCEGEPTVTIFLEQYWGGTTCIEAEGTMVEYTCDTGTPMVKYYAGADCTSSNPIHEHAISGCELSDDGDGSDSGSDEDDSPEWEQWGCTGDGEIFLNTFGNAQCGGDPTGTITQAMFEAYGSQDMFTCMVYEEGMSLVYSCDNGDPIARMYQNEECSGNQYHDHALDYCNFSDDGDGSDSGSDGGPPPGCASDCYRAPEDCDDFADFLDTGCLSDCSDAEVRALADDAGGNVDFKDCDAYPEDDDDDDSDSASNSLFSQTGLMLSLLCCLVTTFGSMSLCQN